MYRRTTQPRPDGVVTQDVERHNHKHPSPVIIRSEPPCQNSDSDHHDKRQRLPCSHRRSNTASAKTPRERVNITLWLPSAPLSRRHGNSLTIPKAKQENRKVSHAVAAMSESLRHKESEHRKSNATETAEHTV